jgi:hypothetical protein
MKSPNILATLNAYLPNNTRSYGTKTNTWKYLQDETTNLLALYTMSMSKSCRLRAYIEESQNLSETCGDACAAECLLNGQKALVVTVYISANTPSDDWKYLIFYNLVGYSPKVCKMFQFLARRGCEDMPIIVAGDFNVDVKDNYNTELVEFMQDTLGICHMYICQRPSIFTREKLNFSSQRMLHKDYDRKTSDAKRTLLMSLKRLDAKRGLIAGKPPIVK